VTLISAYGWDYSIGYNQNTPLSLKLVYLLDVYLHHCIQYAYFICDFYTNIRSRKSKLLDTNITLSTIVNAIDLYKEDYR